MNKLRSFFRFLYAGKMKPWAAFDCEECEDTGLASYEDWIGVRGNRIVDDCRSCKRGQDRRDARRREHEEARPDV